MIKVGDKEIIDLKYGDKRVKKIYKGDDIIAYTLPDGYIELDYLESSNGDYIDTGFVPNVDIGIECKVQKRTESDYWVPFGTREYVTNSDGEETWCTIFLCDSPSSGLAGVAYKLRAGFCSSYINTSSHDITINDEVSIKLDKNTFLFHTQSSNNWIIGDGPNSPMTNYTFKRSILLFACWYRNSVLYAKPARFWYFKLYNSKTNELYRYYVPCISPEGIYGLYDLITETFYKNARTSGIDGFRGG